MRISVPDLIFGFSRALDMVKPQLAGHHLGVAWIASELGQALSLPRTVRAQLFTAAMLHDAGAIPLKVSADDLLFERNTWLHTRAGWALLSRCAFLRPAASFVLFHHTPWSRLRDSGEALLPANLIHLADRAELFLRGGALLDASALESLLARHAGGKFHPDGVEALRALCARRGGRLALPSAQEMKHDLQTDCAQPDLDPDHLIPFCFLFSLITDFLSPFTATHTAATAIVASTAVTVFVVFGLVATLIIVGIFLRRQRGEDVIKVAHDVFALRPVRHATAATRLEIVPTVVITTATAVILLRSGIVKAQFGEQVGAGFGVTMATTLRRFIVRLQRVHRCHGIRDFGGFRGLGLLGTDGAFLLLGFIGLLVLCRFDLSVCGGSGLWRAHGDAGRSLAAGTGGLKCCDQFGLAHGGDTTKSHLLGELLELGQFHIIEIRACCHW